MTQDTILGLILRSWSWQPLVLLGLGLTKRRGTWWIFENWAAAVRVHFSAELKDGLEWEFDPVHQVVLTKPGETLQTTYRAKNLSSQTITAKARHSDRPEEYLDSLDILQCFCFI